MEHKSMLERVLYAATALAFMAVLVFDPNFMTNLSYAVDNSEFVLLPFDPWKPVPLHFPWC
jgi:hypothetical protein